MNIAGLPKTKLRPPSKKRLLKKILLDLVHKYGDVKECDSKVQMLQAKSRVNLNA